MIIPIHDSNPTVRPPVVTVSIIGVATFVFVYQLTLPERLGEHFVFRFGMIPALLLDPSLGVKGLGIPPWATVFTSMFVHGGLLHIAGNMWFLWLFGDNVEDRFGHLRFLVFYLMSGVVAAMTQALIDPGSTMPMIGASGAISGVLGGYAVLFPRARVTVLVWWLLFVQTFDLAALYVIGAWFALQVLNALLADPAEGGVAWFAHVGGFLAGVVITLLFGPRQPRYVGMPPRRGPWG
jgi:membrane associated rhomboid family serine protease